MTLPWHFTRCGRSGRGRGLSGFRREEGKAIYHCIPEGIRDAASSWVLPGAAALAPGSQLSCGKAGGKAKPLVPFPAPRSAQVTLASSFWALLSPVTLQRADKNTAYVPSLPSLPRTCHQSPVLLTHPHKDSHILAGWNNSKGWASGQRQTGPCPCPCGAPSVEADTGADGQRG